MSLIEELGSYFRNWDSSPRQSDADPCDLDPHDLDSNPLDSYS